jgi:hypothetical protein
MGALAIFAAQILQLTLRKRSPTARRSEQALGKLCWREGVRAYFRHKPAKLVNPSSFRQSAAYCRWPEAVSQFAVDEFDGDAAGADPIAPAKQIVNFVGDH